MTKDESVFGIHLTRSSVDSAVSALKHAGFSNSDVSILLPENVQSEELATEHSTKARKGRQWALDRERWWAEPWAGCSAWEPWRFLVSVQLWRRGHC